MKKLIIILSAVTLFVSCGDNKKTASENNSSSETTGSTSTETDDEKTGDFSFDGKSVTGKVTTQYFSSNKETSNFSVLCQHNEGDNSNPNFELLQTTFLTEKEATSNPALKLYHGSSLPSTDPEPGSVSVALSGVGNGLGDKEFTGSDKSTGSITVSNKTLIIKDLTLYNRDGAMKTVNAKIPF